ncbi:MAG: hypothetical protein LQ342_007347 [Letrouitia transgressa]|nr:MAG: hypothetical protein LQ342_007347 [Letrouitia transgressa]
MVFNTVSVSTAVTPTVIETYFSHYLKRKPLRQKPTAHISYHEGLALIRRFLHHASFHTVEDIQAFTSQWVPYPRWVKVDEVTIPERSTTAAADALIEQLGRKGIDKVGGGKWWQWRKEGSVLKAEWIEMRGDYARRKSNGGKGNRVMLYVHGGAYFFGSVDEHRYQMQRHARKLGARVLARVAGDSSFDYIPPHGFLARPSAAWPPPNAGDMEQIALHAVEKVVGDAMPRKSSQHERRVAHDEAVQGFSVDKDPGHLDPKSNVNNPAGTQGAGERPGNTIPGTGHDLSIMLDGELITIKDQIQMYTTNQLTSHPLVSPVLQPSLGGLPPLFILTGGGEMLRDEQIYLAHKAADPAKYPPGEAYLNEYPEARDTISKWEPTDVQLQVWDDLCHVAPTLSFTRPAKYMYRSIAQFGAWALARAQQTDIDIMDDDDMSVISSSSSAPLSSSSSSSSLLEDVKTKKRQHPPLPSMVASEKIGRAGDPLPSFRSHMIRQRVSRHGIVFPLALPSKLPALNVPANEIGVIKPGPVRKWMAAKRVWDTRFAREKRRVQKQRIKEMVAGFEGFGDDEVPPPSALAGRRPGALQERHGKRGGVDGAAEGKRGKSWGMTLWSLWGSKHDEDALEREEKADKDQGGVDNAPPTAAGLEDGAGARRDQSNGVGGTRSKKERRRHGAKSPSRSRSRSRRRVVSYTGQSDPDPLPSALQDLNKDGPPVGPSPFSSTSPVLSEAPDPTIQVTGLASTDGLRPVGEGGKAFPFKLKSFLAPEGGNASTITLRSERVGTPGVDAGAEKELGLKASEGTRGGEDGDFGGKGQGRPGMERFETAKEGL